MKCITTCFLLIGFLFMPKGVKSQGIVTTRDIGIWAGLGVDYELNKKWNVFAIQELRSFENAVRLHRLVSDIGLEYRINQAFKLGAGLRYSYDRKKDYNFTNDIRYNLDFKFKHELTKRFSFHYRLRYQHSYINLFTFVPEIERRSNLRNRIKLQYESKKHELYFSTELFREFVIYEKPEFNGLRFVLGDNFETGLGEFKFGLAYERELNEEYPLNFFFLKLNYFFDLKRD